jgi:hypothetical protein
MENPSFHLSNIPHVLYFLDKEDHMTHTLHRKGAVEDLADDFPMLTIRAKGYNDGSLWRMKKVLEMASRYPIVNFGDIAQGSKFVINLETILKSTNDNLPILHMVFTSKEDVTAYMKELKEADLGISVVISGVFEEIFSCCKESGLKPHTANYSLGVFGKTDKLPEPEVLEVTTMCGHSLVPAAMVRELAQDVRAGKATPEKAAEALAKNCVCGIFNPKRAARLLSLLSPGKAC